MSEHPASTNIQDSSATATSGLAIHPDLARLGLGTHYRLAEDSPDGPCLGRVISRQANRCEIATRHGPRQAEVSGRLSYAAADESELPAVGDWVLAYWDRPEAAGDIGLILSVCPRQSELKRQAPGGIGAVQVVAANVQFLLIIWPLDRVETGAAATPSGNPYVRWGLVQRFLTMARSGGVAPILILSKADLLSPEDLAAVKAQARQRWPELPTLALSNLPASGQTNPPGCDSHAQLLDWLPAASTSVLAGLSGAGKSSLLNALNQQELARVQAVRGVDGKGRHTTTHRELFCLPGGALVIDSPGIRELGLWADGEGLADSFPVLEALAEDCRFGDCRHEAEPGCAVRAAIQAGRLEPSVLEQYRKQQAEVAWLAARQLKATLKTSHRETGGGLSYQEYQEATADQRRWKQIHKAARQKKAGP